MSKNNKNSSPVLAVIAGLLASVIGFVAGFYGFTVIHKNSVGKGDVYVSGNLEIHFPELGSYKTGDSTIIKVGNTEVLIDAGSETGSQETLESYINTVCEDGKLEYVVVTHAHEDHYAGFTTENSIFNHYEIGTIIEFAQITDSKATQKMYNNYIRERNEAVSAGATLLTAKECRESNNYIFNLSASVTMTILDSYYYYNVSETENDHSVCTLISQGDNHFLFTGDLEKKGEEKLVELNALPEVELYKAGHHGSKTSSNDCLMEVIKPERIAVCCCAGTSEYTDTNANQFPTQDFIDRVAPYTKEIYVTSLVLDDEAKTFQSMNGNIKLVSKKNTITVECSNNNTFLKDTVWFKANRTWPSNGVA